VIGDLERAKLVPVYAPGWLLAQCDLKVYVTTVHPDDFGDRKPGPDKKEALLRALNNVNRVAGVDFQQPGSDSLAIGQNAKRGDDATWETNHADPLVRFG
jgi:hypothetical protein